MSYVSQSQRLSKLQSENAKLLLNGLRQALLDAIVIPNETENLGELPDSLKNYKHKDDNNNNGPTLQQIENKLAKIREKQELKERKESERERRIKLYSAMHENNSQLCCEDEFVYEPIDEFSQNFDAKRFAMALVKANK